MKQIIDKWNKGIERALKSKYLKELLVSMRILYHLDITVYHLDKGCPAFLQGGPLSELGHIWRATCCIPKYQFVSKKSTYFSPLQSNPLALCKLWPHYRPHQATWWAKIWPPHVGQPWSRWEVQLNMMLTTWFQIYITKCCWQESYHKVIFTS